MPITALTLAVVGVAFPNAKGEPTRRFAIDLCRPGDPIDLVPEPKNPADPNAVRVLNGQGMQMGYLTAERAPWIGGLIRQGREVAAIFQSSTERGALIRVALGGAQPDLPARTGLRAGATQPTGDTDWWPDDIYPDE